MWNKPWEISGHLYDGVGYENAYWTSGVEVNPRRVLEVWKNSPTHDALLLETGIWKNVRLSVLGVGIHQGFAIIWVSNVPDPLGAATLCR
jgi:hypothetical protein